MFERSSANSWYYTPDHGQLYQAIETQTLGGDMTYRVWLPGSDSVVRIPAANLKVKSWFVEIGSKANVEVSHV